MSNEVGGFVIVPIGAVRGGRVDAVDDDWGAVEATVVLDPQQFGPEALGDADRRSSASRRSTLAGADRSGNLIRAGHRPSGV